MDAGAIIYLSLLTCLTAAALIVAGDSCESDALGYFGSGLFLAGICVMLYTAISGALA